MLQDFLELAYQSIKTRKLRSWLTILGIVLGVATIVTLIALSQGLEDAVTAQFAGLGSDKLAIQSQGSGFGPPGTDAVREMTDLDLHELEQVRGVKLATSRLIRSAAVEFNDELKYRFVVSIPEEEETRELVIEANNYKVAQGRIIDDGDERKITVGADFAKENPIFEDPVELRDTLTIQGIDFKVAGILDVAGTPQVDSSIVLTESALREVLELENVHDILVAVVEPGEDITAVAARIEKKFRNMRNLEEGEEDFSVQTPQQIVETLQSILGVVQGILLGIAAISILVGGIGIMNTMYTSVLERRRDVAIMKSLGAQRKQILLLFLLESGFIGIAGGIAGVLLGIGLSKLIEFAALQFWGTLLIQSQVSVGLIGGSLLFSFLIGTISGVLPARQASALQVVEGLKK